VISTAHGLRKQAKIRVRQPLQTVQVALEDPERIREFCAVICAELNVKEIELLDASAVKMEDFGLEQRLDVNARALGPKIGKRVQEVIRAAKSGAWKLDEGSPVVQLDDGPFELSDGEYTLAVVTADAAPAQSGTPSSQSGTPSSQSDTPSCHPELVSGSSQTVADVLPSGGFVVLNTSITPELAAEGLARDMIREVQETRKKTGLEVSDRINLSIQTTAEKAAAIESNRELIMEETLAVDLTVAELPAGDKDDVITTEAVKGGKI
jgi:isoleucyl-tRNA synthetase